MVEGAGLENRSTARYRRFESCPLRHRTRLAVALWCSLLALLWGAAPASAGEKRKDHGKPSVRLRAAPRMAPAPVHVVFTVQIDGGEDSEALHCLRFEWSWGDGTSSSTEGDCAEFVAGETKVQRLFEADHEYRNEGRYTAEVKVLKGERLLGSDSQGLMLGARKTDPKVEFRDH